LSKNITDSACFLGTLAGAPFSELDQTDQPASLYAATRRLQRRLLMNTYNHICGLSISGLQFFTIYAPGVRPNVTYFSFTRDILNGKPINTYTKEPTTKIWLMISLTLMTLSKLDVLHLLMWWTKALQLRLSCNTSHKQILKQGLKKFVKWYLSYYSDNMPHEPLLAQ